MVERDEQLKSRVNEAMRRASLYLSIYGFGQCLKCNSTWDWCQCPDAYERFKTEFERRWAKIKEKDKLATI